MKLEKSSLNNLHLLAIIDCNYVINIKRRRGAVRSIVTRQSTALKSAIQHNVSKFVLKVGSGM